MNVAKLNEALQKLNPTKRDRWCWTYTLLEKETNGYQPVWLAVVVCEGEGFSGTATNKSKAREIAAGHALKAVLRPAHTPPEQRPLPCSPRSKTPAFVPSKRAEAQNSVVQVVVSCEPPLAKTVLADHDYLFIDGDNFHDFCFNYRQNVKVFVFIGKTTNLPKKTKEWIDATPACTLIRAKRAVENAADMLIAVHVGKLAQICSSSFVKHAAYIVSRDNFGEGVAMAANQSMSNDRLKTKFVGIEVPVNLYTKKYTF